MKKNIMAKNLRQSIVKSLARYIAIVAIIALGAGIFVGLRTTKSDMIATGQRFMDEQNMFDLRLMNTYGWSVDDVKRISQLEDVVHAEGVITFDVVSQLGKSDAEYVFKLYSLPQQINKVYLLGGRMPKSPNECLYDGFHTSDSILGTKIFVSDTNSEDTLNSLNVRELTVVGYVGTPLYIDMSRGSTAIGNGSVSGYVYVPQEAFDVDYYTEIHITLPEKYKAYTSQYEEYVASFTDRFETDLMPIAMERYDYVMKEARKAYREGNKEYSNGLIELNNGKKKMEKELAEALKQLEDGEKELEDSRAQLEKAKVEITNGQQEIDQNRTMLTESKVTLANAKSSAFLQLSSAHSSLLANYKSVNDGIMQVDEGIRMIDEGLVQIDGGISQLESGLRQLQVMVSVTETMMGVAQSSVDRAYNALQAAKEFGGDDALLAELEATIVQLQNQLNGYQQDLNEMKSNQAEYTKQLEDLRVQRQQLVDQRNELLATRATLEDALLQIDAGFVEIQNNQVQAEREFAAAEAQIEAGEAELEKAQLELDKAKLEVENGTYKLREGEAELAKGWEDYYKGKEDAELEIADAEKELADAKIQLDDAREAINRMDEPDVFVLDRNTNPGYLAMESNSEIVEGVSAVFPAFFLLIAALVCITTMTRMVEEERTQIGTLKALGYGNGRIILKYIAYAGSAAIIGCGLGVLAGSVVFPLVLWEAYSTIMLLGDYFVLQIDWPLCFMVVGMYTAVTLLVTWYCCRMTLREVPAQLIRPKAPTSGKKILLEYIPLWNKLSFLNKVMLRNIFRYRQRLLMMMIGIGGCTALLLAGFGVRDSIVDIVSFQFEEITLSDVVIRFPEGVDETKKAEFMDDTAGYVDDVIFYHQSSKEMVYNGRVNDVNFVVAQDGVQKFMDFHFDREKVPYPQTGEAIISVGVAEKLGITEGDTIAIRDFDMKELTLRVSAIFENYVYNYVIVSPETVEAQWNEPAEVQMAFLTVPDYQDVHEAGAYIMDNADVVSVTVNSDIADQVGNMLEALDLIIVTIVICAGSLAVIVLYNLTNINITERIREIATIKVLGFNSKESAAYVFKENLLLSVVGSLFGLVGGVFLLEFIMSQIKVDMVWLPARLLPMSYVWSVILTMLAAVFVDFVLYFRLEKINMAEALKSVE